MFNDCFFSLIQLNPLKNIQGLRIGWSIDGLDLGWLAAHWAAQVCWSIDGLDPGWLAAHWAAQMCWLPPPWKNTIYSRPYAKGPVPKVLVLEKQCIKHKP